MRETKKQITIEGREFIIEKFPAAKSYAILVEIITKALPLNIIGSALENFVPANLLNAAGKQQMSPEEFEQLQYKIMGCVSEKLPLLTVKVVDENNNPQVEDLENNMILWGELLAKALEWQYKDFFTEALNKIGVKMENPDLFKSKVMNTLSNDTAE